MDAPAKALSDRIRGQGWRQGSKLPHRHDLFLSDLRAPVTAEAEALRREQGDRPLAVVHAQRPQEPAMVIISQDCDLVADPAGEPLAEAIPVVRLPKEETLPAANSARYFTLDAEARLVADLTRRLSFEKALLPDRDAEHYFDDEGTAERFRAWCARRYSRVPLPDDFNLVVAGALDRAWSKRGRATDSRAQAMYPWRVILSETEAGVDTAFLVPFDEDRAEEAEVQSLTNALIADAQKRLAKQHEWARRRFGQDVGIRDFTISAAQARPSAAVSLRALMKLPPLALEHLTYAGEEIIGTEPRAEQLS